MFLPAVELRGKACRAVWESSNSRDCFQVLYRLVDKPSILLDSIGIARHRPKDMDNVMVGPLCRSRDASHNFVHFAECVRQILNKRILAGPL